jgi:hypothetical protein
MCLHVPLRSEWSVFELLLVPSLKTLPKIFGSYAARLAPVKKNWLNACSFTAHISVP